METRITILCENTAGAPMRIVGEHGFALLIERGDDAVLFDTGQGLGLLPNAAQLGKDLSAVNKLVLSHGHYDHTGGVSAFVDAGSRPTVYAHPAVFTERFARIEGPEGPFLLPIGFPGSREDLESRGATFDLAPAFREVTPGVFASGEVPRPAGWQGSDSRLVVTGADGAETPDPFLDDLSLLVETWSGPVLVLGCAHAGLEAILEHVQRHTGLNRFHAVLGGTHLASGSREDWETAVRLFEACEVQRVATSHCTGFQAACFLAGRMGAERVVPAAAGTTFRF